MEELVAQTILKAAEASDSSSEFLDRAIDIAEVIERKYVEKGYDEVSKTTVTVQGYTRSDGAQIPTHERKLSRRAAAALLGGAALVGGAYAASRFRGLGSVGSAAGALPAGVRGPAALRSGRPIQDMSFGNMNPLGPQPLRPNFNLGPSMSPVPRNPGAGRRALPQTAGFGRGPGAPPPRHSNRGRFQTDWFSDSRGLPGPPGATPARIPRPPGIRDAVAAGAVAGAAGGTALGVNEYAERRRNRRELTKREAEVLAKYLG